MLKSGIPYPSLLMALQVYPLRRWLLFPGVAPTTIVQKENARGEALRLIPMGKDTENMKEGVRIPRC